MHILVTGAAGFIGYHVCSRLIKKNHSVSGFDNINDYYDQNLKIARIAELEKLNKEKKLFSFFKGNLENKDELKKVFYECSPDIVINLAAQAGVRYSIENPYSYIQSNIVGFLNILEFCKLGAVKHLIFASSSSVFGGNKNAPFREDQNVDHPVSLYGATKKSNEIMAHSYSHLYDLPITGLRFFTVYGPWGRPDMALFLFTKSIIDKKPIKIFNNGNMVRDFTYIDDVAESICRLINKIPSKNENYDFDSMDPSESWAPFKIFNIGNSKAINLMDYIKAIEEELGIIALKEFLPMQPGDVSSTLSSTEKLDDWISYKPSTNIKEGVKEFINWYKNFYKV